MNLPSHRPHRRLSAPWSRALVAGLSLTVAGLAGAQSAPVASAPSGVLNLSATATKEVAQDWMTLVLSVNREGADAAGVQNQLKLAVDAALVEARKLAKPGLVEVQSGSFSIYPRYGQKGTMTGWQGSTELVVQGRDMAAIGQLTGRISTMTIARVGYSLSREAREQVESDITAQAIERFRAKATEQARLFGHSGYTLREVTVSSEQDGGAPVPMVRAAMAMAKTADAEALSVEPGKGTVSATVSGSIQLK